jgi:hypothetical protein
MYNLDMYNWIRITDDEKKFSASQYFSSYFYLPSTAVSKIQLELMHV